LATVEIVLQDEANDLLSDSYKITF